MDTQSASIEFRAPQDAYTGMGSARPYVRPLLDMHLVKGSAEFAFLTIASFYLVPQIEAW